MICASEISSGAHLCRAALFLGVCAVLLRSSRAICEEAAPSGKHKASCCFSPLEKTGPDLPVGPIVSRSAEEAFSKEKMTWGFYSARWAVTAPYMVRGPARHSSNFDWPVVQCAEHLLSNIFPTNRRNEVKSQGTKRDKPGNHMPENPCGTGITRDIEG